MGVRVLFSEVRSRLCGFSFCVGERGFVELRRYVCEQFIDQVWFSFFSKFWECVRGEEWGEFIGVVGGGVIFVYCFGRFFCTLVLFVSDWIADG